MMATRMVPEAPESPRAVSIQQLHAKTLGDLLRLADEHGDDAVVDFLEQAVEVAGSFLAAHDKVVEAYPTVLFDQHETGVSFDPFHEQGEVLVCGGPRGRFRGGEHALARVTDFSQRRLLTILGKALLHAHHAQLSQARTARFTTELSTRLSGEVKLYDTFGLPAPAIEYGFTTLWDVYLEADITDRELRESVIQEWTQWYDEHTAIQTDVYEAVAFTVSDRILAADGPPQEQLCHGFAIQEPLIGEGDVSVLTVS